MIANPPDSVAPTPREARDAAPLWVFAVILVFAVVLRFWNLGAAGISYWDASTHTTGPLGISAQGGHEDMLFQTPPLVPGIFAALFAFWAPIDTLAIGAIALFGVLSVAVLFFAGRRWVGDAPALAGAAALAGMHYHVLFSRQALADAPYALWLLLAAWAFTVAVERGSVGLSVLAGVAAGAAMLTKYHGVLGLVLLGAWPIARCTKVARASAGGETRTASTWGWRAWIVACAAAAVPAAWLAWELQRRIGLSTFLHCRAETFSLTGLFLLPRTVGFIGRSLLEWVSPFVLVPAAAGFLVMLRRRWSGDLLVIAWISLCFLAIPFYRLCPRLLVPVLVPLALGAGVGLDELARRLAPSWKRGRSATLCLVLLLPGAWSARRTLALEDRGYELAARFLEQGRPDPRPDVVVAQNALLFYASENAHPFVCCDEPAAIDVLESGRFRYLVGDLRLLDAPRFREYLAAHGQELSPVAEVGNPLPPSTVVSWAGFEGLDALRSSAISREERAMLETIRIWRPSRSPAR